MTPTTSSGWEEKARELAVLLVDVKTGDTRDTPMWKEKIIEAATNQIVELVSSTREATRREAISAVAGLHVKARKSYASDTWDAGYHDALFDAQKGILRALPE